MQNTLIENNQRYVFIDALRGIASFAVLFHHMLHNSIMEVTLRRILPNFLTIISDYGAFGVQVFFVLSGFVIAHSLRNNALTWSSLNNFILRRQIRLDPPYWFVIVIALLLHRIESAMPSLVASPMPTFSEVLLNFFYLQNIAGVEQIIGVAWTLCIEIQFYVVFLLLLCGCKMLSKLAGKLDSNNVTATFIFLSGLASLIAIHFDVNPAWFIPFWFYFAAGVLCNWCLRKVISRWVFFAFLGVFCLSFVTSVLTPISGRNALAEGMMVGLLTVLAIYIVGAKGHLTDWWNNRILQYLGRISYSLYLVHLTVLVVVLRIGYKITGENELMAVIWFVIAGLISIAFAHLLFWSVERPSMRFASRLKVKEVEISHSANSLS